MSSVMMILTLSSTLNRDSISISRPKISKILVLYRAACVPSLGWLVFFEQSFALSETKDSLATGWISINPDIIKKKLNFACHSCSHATNSYGRLETSRSISLLTSGNISEILQILAMRMPPYALTGVRILRSS